MRKISGQLVSTRPISLPLAAKRLSSFAALENGASTAVSVYLQRAAEAFNQLVQFHDQNKPFKQTSHVKKKNPHREIEEKPIKIEINDETEQDLNPKVDDVKVEKKKKKKSDDVDLKVEVKKQESDKENEEKPTKKVKREEDTIDEENDAKLEKKKKRKKKKKSDDVGLKVEVKKEED